MLLSPAIVSLNANPSISAALRSFGRFPNPLQQVRWRWLLRRASITLNEIQLAYSRESL